MRLIAEIGYKTVVFGKTANYSEIIEALGTATLCSTSGWGADKTYTPEPDTIAVQLVPDELIHMAGEESAAGALATRIEALTKENTALTTRAYAAEKKLKELTDKVEAL